MNSEAGWGVGRVREEGVECHLYANLKSGEGEWGNTGEKELNHVLPLSPPFPPCLHLLSRQQNLTHYPILHVNLFPLFFWK